MADKTELQMNLVAVKRVDPYAKDIIDSSAHVAFYTFNSDESEWEKTDVEGVFFIYSRNAEPLHSIFINNRLNTNSFIEPITGQLELQSQPPFLLYRNERSRIRGFWFYNSSECDRIGELVGRLVKECETSKLTTVSKNHEITRSNANANNVDIFSMLSKAQEDFNNSQNQVVNRMQPTMPTGPGPTSQVATTNPPPVTNNNQPDVTSQSVMNFFAAAKPAAASEVPLFQRLMSKPVPVDQIEKQQRATTPQDGRMSPASVMHHNVMNLGHQQHQSICNNSVGGIESAFNLINLSSPKQYNQDLGTSPLTKFLVTSAVATTIGGGGGGVGILQQQQQQQQQPPPHHKTVSASEIENSQKPLQHLLRKESTGIIQAIQQGGQQQSSATISAAAAAAAASAVVATVPSNKPALMPPTMFLTSSSVSKTITATKEPSISNMQIANCIQRQHSLSGGGAGGDSGGGGAGGGGVVNVDVGSTILTPTVVAGGGGGSGSGSAAINYSRPEPLTQTQLLQAMMYMIQNDPEFIKKLHEAYLKSFTDMVSL